MTSVACLENVEGACTALVNSFEYWESQDYSDAAKYLGVGMSDVYSSFSSCTEGSLWGYVKKAVKTAIAVFVPEVVAAYTIMVNGVNVYEDFSKMMDSCREQDYIDCGSALGDMIYVISSSVVLKK
eukprot:TRINITY_DN4528_c0_g1_i1.p1 TRINITY_DN4528_c0_g1~~TRINITY_DN4528_c0_g1_i1.p1  ORF type:complete len:126 (+),score=26.11 TRINITY_DN4528_c0_g1_i1:314-691(+)